jgi:ankyrin repeat protein
MTKFFYFKKLLFVVLLFSFGATSKIVAQKTGGQAKTNQTVTSRDFCSVSPRSRNVFCPVGEDIPMETPLLEAIRRGNLVEVGRLISEGADANVSDKNGLTPLILASGYGDVEAIKLLIAARADINSVSKYRNTTPLINATQCSAAVRLLVESGAAVDLRNFNQETALMQAAANGNIASVKILLDSGADIHAKDIDEKTSLAFAVRSGDAGIVKLFLDLGANKDLLIESGSAINLDIAALNSSVEIMKILLAAGANPNARGKYGTTPITAAAQRNNAEVARLLIEAGADPNIKGSQTTSPITWASNYGYTEVIKVLIAAKANVFNKADWWSAFISAARNDHIESMDILLKAGANINERAYDGKTALMYAASQGKIKAVKFLIEKGADLNLRDEDDDVSALSLAVKNNQTEVIQLLRNAGAVE